MINFTPDELNQIIKLDNYDSISNAIRAEMGSNDNQSLVNHLFERYKQLAAFSLNLYNDKIKIKPQIPGGLTIGDYVCVNFNNSKYTLTKKAKILKLKLSDNPADYWILEDYFTGEIYYLNEFCTITKVIK